MEHMYKPNAEKLLQNMACDATTVPWFVQLINKTVQLWHSNSVNKRVTTNVNPLICTYKATNFH